jgi:hypothetical protein
MNQNTVSFLGAQQQQQKQQQHRQSEPASISCRMLSGI